MSLANQSIIALFKFNVIRADTILDFYSNTCCLAGYCRSAKTADSQTEIGSEQVIAE